MSRASEVLATIEEAAQYGYEGAADFHDALTSRGFKLANQTQGLFGGGTNTYTHKNGQSVAVNFNRHGFANATHSVPGGSGIVGGISSKLGMGDLGSKLGIGTNTVTSTAGLHASLDLRRGFKQKPLSALSPGQPHPFATHGPAAQGAAQPVGARYAKGGGSRPQRMRSSGGQRSSGGRTFGGFGGLIGMLGHMATKGGSPFR